MQAFQSMSIWDKIQGSTLGDTIAESTWMFPTIETIHVIALVTVVGTISIMDLRMIGVASRDVALTQVSKDTLPFTWAAFVLAAITGTLLFTSKAHDYVNNPYFLFKLVFMALAGLNMMYFHFFTYRTVEHWDRDPSVPGAAKLAGFLSLAFWLAVVFCGRLIGFTLSQFAAQ